MKSLLQKLVRASLVAGLGLVATLNALAQDEAPGIVRISKPHTTAAQMQQVVPASFGHGVHSGGMHANCDCQDGVGPGYAGCPHFYHGCYGFHRHYGCGRHPTSQAMIDYFHCKFGYFIPTGGGGAGIPFCGKYARVYPQDPQYFDQRDGQVWAAQGYGLPMAVPLAPTVGHTYNYGWGTPSSRLTPVSRPAY